MAWRWSGRPTPVRRPCRTRRTPRAPTPAPPQVQRQGCHHRSCSRACQSRTIRSDRSSSGRSSRIPADHDGNSDRLPPPACRRSSSPGASLGTEPATSGTRRVEPYDEPAPPRTARRPPAGLGSYNAKLGAPHAGSTPAGAAAAPAPTPSEHDGRRHRRTTMATRSDTARYIDNSTGPDAMSGTHAPARPPHTAPATPTIGTGHSRDGRLHPERGGREPNRTGRPLTSDRADRRLMLGRWAILCQVRRTVAKRRRPALKSGARRDLISSAPTPCSSCAPEPRSRTYSVAPGQDHLKINNRTP